MFPGILPIPHWKAPFCGNLCFGMDFFFPDQILGRLLCLLLSPSVYFLTKSRILLRHFSILSIWWGFSFLFYSAGRCWSPCPDFTKNPAIWGELEFLISDISYWKISNCSLSLCSMAGNSFMFLLIFRLELGFLFRSPLSVFPDEPLSFPPVLLSNSIFTLIFSWIWGPWSNDFFFSHLSEEESGVPENCHQSHPYQWFPNTLSP